MARPRWLTVGRFGVAAPLLALVAHRRVRAALRPAVVGWGALGYGAVIVIQNAGIERTSVSHAALIVGVVPVLVALMAAALGRGSTGPVAWLGFALALAGVGLVAGGGSGASAAGDGLVLASVTLSAAAVTAQPRLLAGRDPVAVTAVQLGSGALVALPAALVLEGLPAAPPAEGWALPAAVLLATAGTLLPFTLFAFGQARIAPAARRRVPEPRAAGRRARRRRRVRRRVRPRPARRRPRAAGRRRAQRDPATGQIRRTAMRACRSQPT